MIPEEKLLKKALWGRWQLPTAPQRRVLLHLIQPGEPRLFIQNRENGGFSSSVTNSESAPGFGTMIDSWGMVSGGFLEPDPELNKVCRTGIQAFRISKKGREALAQYRIWEILEIRRAQEVQKTLELIEEVRRDFHLPEPVK